MSSQGYHGRGELASYIEHNGIVGPTVAHATIDDNIQLTSADSGGTFSMIAPVAIPYVIRLPTTAPGLHFRFVLIADATFPPITIRATGDHFYGIIVEAAAAGDGVQINGDDSINILSTADAGVVVDIQGVDSEHWYVYVATLINNSVSVS